MNARSNDEQPTGLGIGDAIANLKDGNRVRRKGWPGTGLLELMPTKVEGQPLIMHFDGQGGGPHQWYPGHADLLATDWEVL